MYYDYFFVTYSMIISLLLIALLSFVLHNFNIIFMGIIHVHQIVIFLAMAEIW